MDSSEFPDLYSIYNSILERNDNEIRKEEEEVAKLKRENDKKEANFEYQDNFKFLINYYIYRNFIIKIFPQIVRIFLERINQYRFNSTQNVLKTNDFLITISLNEAVENPQDRESLKIRYIPIDINWYMTKNVEINLNKETYSAFKDNLVNFVSDYQIGKIEENKIIIQAPITKIMYAYYLECERIARLDEEMARFNEEGNVFLTLEEQTKLNSRIKRL